MERRLAAILCADLVGYSQLVGADEEGTLAAVKSLQENFVEPLVAEHRGRIVKIMGDGFLIEFQSAVDAVNCAVGWQTQHGAHVSGKTLEFRIGINLGDIVIDGGDIFGDGVNIAARLEALAEPGGIVLSDLVYQSVRAKLDAGFESGGTQTLKNIAEPVRVWTWTGAPRYGVAQVETIPSLGKPSILVLPFTNMSGDSEQVYFSEGITEDITAGLSRFHELSVFARNSAFAFQGSSKTARQISLELGARYVLEGSVRKLGNNLRLSVQLSDVGSARQLWAERYDRPLEDVFAVQEAVSEAVVATVIGRVTKTAHEQALRKRPEQLLAYDCWLRGQHELLLWNADSDLQALNWFEKSLQIDPYFARAHSSVALLLNGRILTAPGLSEEEADRKSALRHARLSVEYDDSDARSHLALAWISLFRSDLGRAARHFRICEELNPNAADNLMNCAVAAAYFGHPAQASQLANQAKKLNPLHPDWYLYMQAQIRFLAGEFEEAYEMGHPYIEEFPELGGWTTAALGALGWKTKAETEASRFLEIVENCWAGSKPMQPPEAVEWFMSINSYLGKHDRKLLINGLQVAELPAPNCDL